MIWKPQPLSSGGLILSYQCSNQCRHCLYASSPVWRHWATEIEIDTILTEISKNKQFLTGIHIGGGEPLLQPDLIAYTVRKAVAQNIPLDYVETNAFWCWCDDKTESVFSQLREAGLPAVLISVSPFHIEFVPMENVERTVRIGRRIFGNSGVHIYTPFFYQQFQGLNPKQTVPLEDYIQEVGEEKSSLLLADQFTLIPNGRVPVKLDFLFQRQPAFLYYEETCDRELSSPHHIHIDLYGNYIAGLCAGISLGDARDLSQLYAGIELDHLPVVEKLVTGGVERLMEWAVSEHGYVEDPDGYIAKCHLCLDIRRHLVRSGAGYKELAPLAFYINLE